MFQELLSGIGTLGALPRGSRRGRPVLACAVASFSRTKPASYADILAAPDDCVAEVVEGDLHTSPRPASRHALAMGALNAELWAPFQRGRGGPGGWWILVEPELHLGTDILVPDLCGWRRARLPRIPDAAYFTLAPDWVCEVVSPATARLDRVRKLPAYARHGVEHAWLVDPLARTLEVFGRAGQRWTLLATRGGADAVQAQPFEAIALDLAVLWDTGV